MNMKMPLKHASILGWLLATPSILCGIATVLFVVRYLWFIVVPCLIIVSGVLSYRILSAVKEGKDRNRDSIDLANDLK